MKVKLNLRRESRSICSKENLNGCNLFTSQENLKADRKPINIILRNISKKGDQIKIMFNCAAHLCNFNMGMSLGVRTFCEEQHIVGFFQVSSLEIGIN